jgi:hypothetical protein
MSRQGIRSSERVNQTKTKTGETSMKIRILNIVGVMGMMIASAVSACDEPVTADSGAGPEQVKVVSSASSETKSDSN